MGRIAPRQGRLRVIAQRQFDDHDPKSSSLFSNYWRCALTKRAA
jgi:hypothetical protein